MLEKIYRELRRNRAGVVFEFEERRQEVYAAFEFIRGIHSLRLFSVLAKFRKLEVARVVRQSKKLPWLDECEAEADLGSLYREYRFARCIEIWTDAMDYLEFSKTGGPHPYDQYGSVKEFILRELVELAERAASFPAKTLVGVAIKQIIDNDYPNEKLQKSILTDTRRLISIKDPPNSRRQALRNGHEPIRRAKAATKKSNLGDGVQNDRLTHS